MIESDLYNYLKDNVASTGDRVYPNIMPQGCEKPALVYTVINDRDVQAGVGCVTASEARIQIDVYATEDYQAREVREEVKAALYSFSHYPIDINWMDGFEEDTELFRQIIDFKIRR